jgi:cytochrome d ubiquinol oxidase subunit I
VYGQLLTAESVSPLAAPAIATSLAVFASVYFVVFGAGIAYLLQMMRRLPSTLELEPPHIPQRAAGITPAAAINPITTPLGSEHGSQRRP